MSIQHYRYTLERLNKLIYILTIHEGDIKKRLVDALTQWWCLENSFPEDLKEFYRDINKEICKIPKDEYENTFKRSLQKKRLKTCKNIAAKIVDLESMLEEYINNFDE